MYPNAARRQASYGLDAIHEDCSSQGVVQVEASMLIVRRQTCYLHSPSSGRVVMDGSDTGRRVVGVGNTLASDSTSAVVDIIGAVRVAIRVTVGVAILLASVGVGTWIADVKTKAGDVNIAVTPDEESTEDWLGEKIEDTVEDGFGVR